MSAYAFLFVGGCLIGLATGRRWRDFVLAQIGTALVVLGGHFL